MADFIFRMESFELSETQKDKIALAIQGAVLTELARLDLHGDKAKVKQDILSTGSNQQGGFNLYSPIKWHGGILRPAEDVAGGAGRNLTVMDADKGKTAA